MSLQKILSTSLAVGALFVGLGALSDAYAQGTASERRDCRADAMRLCGEFVPDVARITACMQQNVRNLTPQCRKHFQPARRR